MYLRLSSRKFAEWFHIPAVPNPSTVAGAYLCVWENKRLVSYKATKRTAYRRDPGCKFIMLHWPDAAPQQPKTMLRASVRPFEQTPRILYVVSASCRQYHSQSGAVRAQESFSSRRETECDQHASSSRIMRHGWILARILGCIWSSQAELLPVRAVLHGKALFFVISAFTCSPMPIHRCHHQTVAWTPAAVGPSSSADVG